MKLTKGTIKFWYLTSINLLISVILSFTLLSVYQNKIAIVIVFIFTIINLLSFFSDIKKKLLLKVQGQYTPELINLADEPLLDQSWLREQTEQLEYLGFQQLADIKINSSFGRCLSHPQQYAYAEIAILFSSTGEFINQQISIGSMLEEDWCLGTINRLANINDAIMYGFWWKPNSVRIFCHPDITLEQLWWKHLNFRQDMINNLNLPIQTDVSWENYVKQENIAAAWRRYCVEKKPLWLNMIKTTLFELNPQSEWWGKYRKFVVNR